MSGPTNFSDFMNQQGAPSSPLYPFGDPSGKVAIGGGLGAMNPMGGGGTLGYQPDPTSPSPIPITPALAGTTGAFGTGITGGASGLEQLIAMAMASQAAGAGPGGAGPNTGTIRPLQPYQVPGGSLSMTGPTPMDAVNPFQSSGLPINEALLAQAGSGIYDNPELAITLGGAAGIGTPGYYNLQQAGGSDPYSVYAAMGGNILGDPVEYLNFLNGMYQTMGKTGAHGGGTINAGVLLTNLVNAPKDSELGKIMAQSPETFYTMATDIASASGMSPMGQQALKSQLAGMYAEYMDYALRNDADDLKPFNAWIASSHPEVVKMWGQE